MLGRVEIDRGDAGRGAAPPPTSWSRATYRSQHVDHAYLEPEAGVGWLDDDGVLTLRVSTQVIEQRPDVARILGCRRAGSG